MAFGAERWAVFRFSAMEGILLALLGGFLGIVLAYAALALIRRSLSAQTVLPTELAIDSGVLLFSAAVTVLATLLFSVVPATQVARLQPGEVIKTGGRGATEGRSRSRFLRSAVVIQVALAFTLILGTSVALRSLVRLLAVDPGFRADRIVSMHLNLPIDSGISTEAAVARGLNFYERLIEELTALPGIDGAATVTGEPFGYLADVGQRTGTTVVGRPSGDAPGPIFQYGIVSPNYFRLMGIPLIEGRPFANADDYDSPRVILIDERLARLVFPDEDPLGHELVGFGTIVGIVGSVKTTDLAEPAEPAVYIPFRQFPSYEETVLVRTDLPATTVASLARSLVQNLDPNVAVPEVTPLQRTVERTLGPQFLAGGFLGGLGSVALALALLGIYGILSYGVNSRMREIGIRMALGSTSTNVVNTIVVQGAALVALGLVLGTSAFLLLEDVMSALVFEIAPGNPAVIAMAAALFMAAGVLASWVPAARAGKVDPLVVLRAD